MESTTAIVITAIISAAAAIFGSWLTYLASGTGDLRREIADLRERVAAMEDENAEALTALNAATSFIDQVGLWIYGGSRAPLPRPPEQITERVNAELWRRREPEEKP